VFSVFRVVVVPPFPLFLSAVLFTCTFLSSTCSSTYRSMQQVTERLDGLITQIREIQRPCMDGGKPANVLLVCSLPSPHSNMFLHNPLHLLAPFCPLPRSSTCALRLLRPDNRTGCSRPHPPLLCKALARPLGRLSAPDDAGPGGPCGFEVRHFPISQ
jgi:hypothetical protein